MKGVGVGATGPGTTGTTGTIGAVGTRGGGPMRGVSGVRGVGVGATGTGTTGTGTTGTGTTGTGATGTGATGTIGAVGPTRMGNSAGVGGGRFPPSPLIPPKLKSEKALPRLVPPMLSMPFIETLIVGKKLTVDRKSKANADPPFPPTPPRLESEKALPRLVPPALPPLSPMAVAPLETARNWSSSRAESDQVA